MSSKGNTGGLLFRPIAGVCAVVMGMSSSAIGAPIPTTIEDFFLPGTQPNTINHPIADSNNCAACHSVPEHDFDPTEGWVASMMGQAARDPIFHAALTIANQDVANSGDLCLRCHTPGGWLAGRSEPTDGSMLEGIDFQGVSCNFCHRMVDPVYKPGVSPDVDLDVFNGVKGTNPGLTTGTTPDPHTGSYVVDFFDRRRGPFDLGDFSFHAWELSPFHQDSAMCATCHDVSNPAFTAQPDGTYALNAVGQPHEAFDPTDPPFSKADMFPVERTYSEWLMSDFAIAPIDMGGRFGGDLALVSSCQDCHMPDQNANACRIDPTLRPDMPQHAFNGGNNWVINAVRSLYPDLETGLTAQLAADSISRAEEMLMNASDVELTEDGSVLNVRVINQSGHKLPTGYAEGRQMWINVQFFDDTDGIVAEHGAYDDVTAELTKSDTKVYEAKQGVSAEVSAASGGDIPVGEGFHFAANNVWLKDNRIPPRGFTNANFLSVQAQPVAYSYMDGQYWDDTEFSIPENAVRAEVRVYFQLVSKEYIEFLRDDNDQTGVDPMNPSTGEIAYEQWVLHGKSPKVEMDFAMIEISGGCPADFTGEGDLNFFDVSAFLNAFGMQLPSADLTGDANWNFFDVSEFLNLFGQGCP
ncbi:MAG: GC-type dockerin domain-anchored protein [Phycisphaerales bacterium]